MSVSPKLVRGFVVSDLHMFSVSSTYERRLRELSAIVDASNVVVLNGDTFDFKRSKFQSNAVTINAALEWLSQFVENHPSASFEYVLGNHDCIPAFVSKLKELAALHRNLTIHSDLVQIGEHLFLHGDACDLAEGATDLSIVRARYEVAERNLRSIIFSEIVTRTGTNLIEYVRHRPDSLARKILQYLDIVFPSFRTSVSTITFGHTHAAFSDLTVDGIRFFNTGTAVRGLRFAPRQFETDSAIRRTTQAPSGTPLRDERY